MKRVSAHEYFLFVISNYDVLGCIPLEKELDEDTKRLPAAYITDQACEDVTDFSCLLMTSSE